MKNLLLLCMCVFIVTACTKFEIRNEIKPKIYIVGNSVGVEYMLGDILVSDELKQLSDKTIKYFEDNKDNITMRLYIEYNAEVNTSCYFNYFIGGIKIATNKDVVSSDLLLAKKDSISGFVMLNQAGSGKSSKEETPQKMEKIQEAPKPIELEQSGDKKL